ncbi:MAG: tetratricopeptide repeat protein [Geminicoccaceae bacterium]
MSTRTAPASSSPLGLARLLARQGRLDEAESVLERACQDQGQPMAVTAELARLLQSRRRYGNAEDRWRTALAATPDLLDAQQGLLRALRLQCRFTDAERLVAAGLARQPRSRQLLLEAARLSFEREAYPEAARRYHAALAAPGPAAEALHELAEVQLRRQRFDGAEAILRRLVDGDPRQATWRVAMAKAAEERGDLDLALQRWIEVLQVDVRHLSARIAIGRLQEAAGRSNEAEAAYRDLVETHPDAIEPFLELGRMALAHADPFVAATWLERALALRPDDWQATSRMIRAVTVQRRFGKARAMARDLAARLPDHIDAHFLAAWVEERAGRTSRAERLLREIQTLFPQAFEPALRLAELLSRDGRTAGARDVLEAAHADHPDTLSLQLARIDAAFAMGADIDAARLVEALHADYPEHREVQKRLARVEIGQRRYVAARRLWAEVTRHDRRVSGPPLHLERLDSRPIPPPDGEIRLFTRLRNEAVRLPWLFDFYRSQGVDRFFVVDNGSDDGSRDWLLAQPDTHLFLTADSYAVYGGGQRWLNHLLNRHGSGTWCLTVDVDEVLGYPHAERLGLQALTAHLDRCGAEALFAVMVDMYAEDSLADVAYGPGDNPLALCPCFDRAGYVHRDCPDFPFHLVVGGLVSRYLFDRREDGVYLHKVPLVRWQPGLHYASSTHTLFPVPMAAETGVLLHFKFMADFIDRARIEAERKQYWQGAKRYSEFSRRFAQAAHIDFRCELTERFHSTAQLVELGLMRSSPALDALARPLSQPLPGWAVTIEAP